MSARPLVLAAHGTADPAGQAVVEQVAAGAGRLLGVPALVGYVDVCGPTLAEVLAEPAPATTAGHAPATTAGHAPAPPVVVPFFLASGYHVRHDVPAAVRHLPGALVTPALGVEDEVAQALAARVREAAAPGPAPEAVVVTGAGSSVAAARAEVEQVSRAVGELLGVAAGTAYLSGPGPRPEEEITRLRGLGHGRVVLAAHLLAPGHFLSRAREVAAGHGAAATDALGTHPLVRALVLRRYREAAGADR